MDNIEINDYDYEYEYEYADEVFCFGIVIKCVSNVCLYLLLRGDIFP
jgi:hypothetical protein